MSELATQIDDVSRQKQLLEIQEGLTINKALNSDDPEAILKAMQRLKDVEVRTPTESKSFVFDPLAAHQAFGYRTKPVDVGYGLLRGMAKAPLISAIIGTRQDQVAEFAQPQSDKFACGFVVRRKQIYGILEGSQPRPTRQDLATIQMVTEFLLNGGAQNSWAGDDFDTFLRKIAKDTLELDQMTFETVRNRRGTPMEFFATDAATYRIADSYDDEEYAGTEREQINGYYPSYVQVLDSRIVNEFYPWELCFGVRNPSTSIYRNGYGESELEKLIMTVTAMLHADQYNSNFFKVGSAPKGILKVTNGVSQTRLDEFRQAWYAQVAGVKNAHKLPVIEAEKMDFLNLQMSNRDMEFAQYQEYLIKIACALYKIDPEEIGFKTGATGGGNAPMFEGNNAARLKYSKDKGLRPLLRHIQAKINKYIIGPMAPGFEFVFVGLDADTAEKELELDIKKVGSFMTINEMRKKYGLSAKIAEGDFPLNSTYAQMMQQQQNAEQMKQQGNQESNEAVDGMEQGYDDDQDDDDDNPFMKSLNGWADKTFNL